MSDHRFTNFEDGPKFHGIPIYLRSQDSEVLTSQNLEQLPNWAPNFLSPTPGTTPVTVQSVLLLLHFHSKFQTSTVHDSTVSTSQLPEFLTPLWIGNWESWFWSWSLDRHRLIGILDLISMDLEFISGSPGSPWIYNLGSTKNLENRVTPEFSGKPIQTGNSDDVGDHWVTDHTKSGRVMHTGTLLQLRISSTNAALHQ